MRMSCEPYYKNINKSITPPLFAAIFLRLVYTTDMQPKFYGAAAQYNRSNRGGLGQILKIVGLVVGVIILISIAFIVYNLLTSGSKNSAAQMVARQRQLLTFMTNNQASITNPDLKTINSNATSLESSDNYAITQGLRTFGLTAVTEAITKLEADSTSSKTLAAAVVQSRFDAVYLQLLREKIAATQQLANTVLPNANGSMKTAIQTMIANRTTIDEKLAKLQL